MPRNPRPEPAGTDHAIYDALVRGNTDTNPETVAEFDIWRIPTVVRFDPNGGEVDRIIGVPPRAAFSSLLSRSAPTGGVSR